MKKILIVPFLVLILLISCKNRDKAQETKPIANEEVIEGGQTSTVSYEVKIDGMTCSGCESTIEGAVKGLNGVKSVKASHENANAIIEVLEADADTTAIMAKIDQAGYAPKAIALK